MMLFLSLITGTITGLAFGLLKLPVPAPPTFAGILGIIGLWIGYIIATHLIKNH